MMVTHRKSLLALMDTVYVLENGQLRNVNELGGLDLYLQRLEGIKEEQVAKEIANEKSYVLPNAVDDHIGLQRAVQPVATSVILPTNDPLFASTQPEQPQIFTIDHSYNIYNIKKAMPIAQEELSQKIASEDDGEVVIKLH